MSRDSRPVSVAKRARDLLEGLLGRPLPIRLRAWDGSETGPADTPTLVMTDKRALRRLLWRPDELGLARAYVSGDIDIDGDLYEALQALNALIWQPATAGTRDFRAIAGNLLRLGVLGPPPAPPQEEMSASGTKQKLFQLLKPGGRLLNQQIAITHARPRDARRSFIDAYVFPDGELAPVETTVALIEQAGFEIGSVQALREHYARTLRAWVANLDAEWVRAVALTSRERARVWRLYMAACAIGFDSDQFGLNQVLAVRSEDCVSATEPSGAGRSPRRPSSPGEPPQLAHSPRPSLRCSSTTCY